MKNPSVSTTRLRGLTHYYEDPARSSDITLYFSVYRGHSHVE